MRILEQSEMAAVGGGDDADVDANLGAGIAYVLHGLTSKEAMVGGLLSPAGAVVGAILHYSNKH